MRKPIVILIFLLAISAIAFPQGKENWLIQKFKKADTILLVSHEATAGVGIIDSSGKRLPLPGLIVQGKPNYNIIKEQKIIKDAELDTLIQILSRPFEDSIIHISKCFIPHHAIFIIKNGRVSYVDICFGCRGFVTSKDLSKMYAFDDRKWAELESFFIKLGFKYELE